MNIFKLAENYFEKKVRERDLNQLMEKSLEEVDQATDYISHLTKQLSQKEHQLYDEREKYRHMYVLLESIVDSMPGIVWAKDLNGNFLLTNKMFRDNMLGGCSIEDTIGYSFEDFSEGLTNTLHIDSKRTDKILLETLEINNFIEKGVVNNEYVIYRTTKGPLYDGDKKLIGTVGFGRDITKESKQAFVILEGIEEAEKTCPQRCMFSQEMVGILGNTMGILHNVISNTCDLYKENNLNV